MKILILLLFSLSSWAQFAPVSEIDSGSVTTVYRSQAICPGQCLKIPVGYNKAFHKKAEIMKPDMDNPVVTKSEVETCLDDDDCQAKLEAKTCADSEEIAVKVLDSDPKEVYCTKTTYPQIGSGRFEVVEDQDLKAAWQASQAQKKADEQAMQMALKAANCGKRVKARVSVINAKKGLSKTQRKQLVNNFKSIIPLLDAGSLDIAKDEISAVVADGTLVTEDDKLKIIAEIDACK